MHGNIINQVVIQISFPEAALIFAIGMSVYMTYRTFNNMADSKNNIFQWTWKDIIWIATLLVGMTSSYFTMKAKVDNLESVVQSNQKMLRDNNLELINYKLNSIQKSQDEFNKAWDDFLDDYYKRNRGNSD